MRSSPPLPGKVHNISYPDIPSEQLPNGLTALLVEDHRLPLISLKLALPLGRVSNPAANGALSSLTISLLKEGTKRLSSREISARLDHYAIHYESHVSMEYTTLSLDVLSRHVRTALELLRDFVLHPTLPADELDRLKVRWKSHLISQRSQADFLANERAYQSLFQGHPYEQISALPSHLDLTSRPAVREFYQAQVGPRGALLAFAGDVGWSKAAGLAAEFFGSWQAKPAVPVHYGPAPAPGGFRIELVDRPHSVQSRVVLAAPSLARNDPHITQLRMANQVLGGGASARLFLNLREDKGYTYGAYSVCKNYRFGGIQIAAASVRQDVTLEALQEMRREVGGLVSRPPDEQELARCRAELIGRFTRQMETPESIASLELIRRLYGLPEDYYQTYIPRLESVGPQQVVAMAGRLLDSGRLTACVVADRRQVEEQLGSLGELRVCDTEGNSV